MAERRDDPKSSQDKRSHPDQPLRRDRAVQFARAIARAEFGRFYWNDAAEQDLREAMKRKPRR